nr:hypothetical protein [Veillonella denticariosi]
MLGYFPPNSLRNIVYVTVVIVVTIIVFIIYSSRYRRQVMGASQSGQLSVCRCGGGWHPLR